MIDMSFIALSVRHDNVWYGTEMQFEQLEGLAKVVNV